MHPVRAIARLDFKSAADSLLLANFRREIGTFLSLYRKYVNSGGEPQENVLLGCHPRGGSTWLAELLTTHPKYEMIWEPFNITWEDSAKRNGFRNFNYIAGEKLSNRQFQYASDVLRGNRVEAGHLGPEGDLERLRTVICASSYVLKCTDAQMILHHLYRSFPTNTVLLLRHPCAVVSSQLAHGGWSEVKKESVPVSRDISRILDSYPEWEPIWSSCETQEETLAFIWGCQVLIPLNQPERQFWHVLTYEDLVREPRPEVERLFDYLDENVPSSIWRRLDQPSVTARKGSNVTKDKDPLQTWKRRLGHEQADRILQVVHEMGVHFYDETLRPNRDRLARRVCVAES